MNISGAFFCIGQAESQGSKMWRIFSSSKGNKYASGQILEKGSFTYTRKTSKPVYFRNLLQRLQVMIKKEFSDIQSLDTWDDVGCYTPVQGIAGWAKLRPMNQNQRSISRNFQFCTITQADLEK